MPTKTEPRFNHDPAGNMRRIVESAHKMGWRWSQTDQDSVYVIPPNDLDYKDVAPAMKLTGRHLRKGLDWWNWNCCRGGEGDLSPEDESISEDFIDDRPATEIYPEVGDAILRHLGEKAADSLFGIQFFNDPYPQPDPGVLRLSELPNEVQQALVGYQLFVDTPEIYGWPTLAMVAAKSVVVISVFGTPKEVAPEDVILYFPPSGA